MHTINKKTKNKKNKGVKRRTLRDMLRSCERAYGEKLVFKNKKELSLWMSSRDPYFAELFCE